MFLIIIYAIIALYRIGKKSIAVSGGSRIMPVTNVKQIKRSARCPGTYLPSQVKAIVDRFGDNPQP